MADEKHIAGGSMPSASPAPDKTSGAKKETQKTVYRTSNKTGTSARKSAKPGTKPYKTGSKLASVVPADVVEKQPATVAEQPLADAVPVSVAAGLAEAAIKSPAMPSEPIEKSSQPGETIHYGTDVLKDEISSGKQAAGSKAAQEDFVPALHKTPANGSLPDSEMDMAEDTKPAAVTTKTDAKTAAQLQPPAQSELPAAEAAPVTGEISPPAVVLPLPQETMIHTTTLPPVPKAVRLPSAKDAEPLQTEGKKEKKQPPAAKKKPEKKTTAPKKTAANKVTAKVGTPPSKLEKQTKQPPKTEGYHSKYYASTTQSASRAQQKAQKQAEQDRPPSLLDATSRARTRVLPAALAGNLLYTLGFAAEYRTMQTWRVLRDAVLFMAQLVAWLATLLYNALRVTVSGLARDIARPFENYKHRRQQLARVREQLRRRGGAHDEKLIRGLRLKNALQILAHVGVLVLPLIAVTIFAATVYSLVTMQYALAVEVNGQVLGYVADQRVVDDAKELLRGRIKLAKGQEVADWQLTPTYSISRAPGYTTSQQLVNQILLNSENPNDLVQATGLYIDGDLYAVTDKGDQLQKYLDELLNSYYTDAPEGAVVRFTRTVECNVAQEEVFFASSVEKYDDLIKKLQRNVTPEQVAVANGADTISEIALANGMTYDLLMQRNPAVAQQVEESGLGEEYVPEAGKSLLLVHAEPFLQVETVVRQQTVEEIPFQVLEVETNDRALGTRAVVQEGVNGQQEVWDDYIYIAGELARRERVNDLTVVLSQPVDQIVEVGTYDFADRRPDDITGAYMFPVPSSVWSSRGMSGFHRGVDINAPVGEPIFACQKGTVIAAGWHYSYGYHVVIDHGNGMVTLYAHCSSLAVTQGQQVELGQYIGAVGSTGNSSGPHLHLEFQLNGRLVNPKDYITPPAGYRYNWR